MDTITNARTQIIDAAGRGDYDFDYEATRLCTTRTGRTFVIADRWCGYGSVEGECYRLHIGEVTDSQAELLRSAARGERNADAGEILHRMQIDWVRVANADAALQAIARAATAN